MRACERVFTIHISPFPTWLTRLVEPLRTQREVLFTSCRQFFSTRRLGKNSPGLFAHKSPTCCGHQWFAIVSCSFLLLSIAFYSKLSPFIALYCSLKSKLTPVSAIYSFQNLLLLIFFEKIWCKGFAVSKPCRTFALAKRNKAHRRVSWATFFERFS